jgi:uncharacterized radical SAM superfamily Fe-S cluster-containing enzyme
MLLLKKTTSVCPEDLKLLEAELWEIDGQVVMKKTCPEHGSFEDVYWSDYQEYVRAEKFRDDAAECRCPGNRNSAVRLTAGYAKSIPLTLPCWS